MTSSKPTVGRPLKFKSVSELQEKITEYFKLCDLTNRPYTITGLAVHLDTSRETILEYEARDEFVDTIKRAKLICHQYAEEKLYTNSQVAGIIFSLKNNYGWKDKTEQDITSNGNTIAPILGGKSNVSANNSDKQNPEPKEED